MLVDAGRTRLAAIGEGTSDRTTQVTSTSTSRQNIPVDPKPSSKHAHPGEGISWTKIIAYSPACLPISENAIVVLARGHLDKTKHIQIPCAGYCRVHLCARPAEKCRNTSGDPTVGLLAHSGGDATEKQAYRQFINSSSRSTGIPSQVPAHPRVNPWYVMCLGGGRPQKS